ncbi:hypothetical protein HAX54_000494 [Datura stramonium]|uniref:Uncharacterized protein n=1 Tax=Datura stramonium TaxID=4076 RepID=A0ABS8WTT2_DATST|nr:hypothetical protein [Datura stramonium]
MPRVTRGGVFQYACALVPCHARPYFVPTPVSRSPSRALRVVPRWASLTACAKDMRLLRNPVAIHDRSMSRYLSCAMGSVPWSSFMAGQIFPIPT